MKNKSHNESGLRQLFEDQLKDIYWAEKAITKAMPEVVEKVSSQELIDALTEHMDETVQQTSRLENVFEIIGVKAEGEKCEAMEGILKEVDDMIEDFEEGPVCDAAVIAAVQKVEHYEIATYGSLRSFANQLGENEVASLFEETLEEEKTADKKLTELAESIINTEAAAGESESSRQKKF